MKNYLKVLIASLGMYILSMQTSYAAIDAGITTALTGAGTDVATLGAAVLVVIVGVAAVKYLRRVL